MPSSATAPPSAEGAQAPHTPPGACLLPTELKDLPWVGLKVEQKVHKSDSTTTQYLTTRVDSKSISNVATVLEWLGFVG